jgi:hypothetical protein
MAGILPRVTGSADRHSGRLMHRRATTVVASGGRDGLLRQSLRQASRREAARRPLRPDAAGVGQ